MRRRVIRITLKGIENKVVIRDHSFKNYWKYNVAPHNGKDVSREYLLHGGELFSDHYIWGFRHIPQAKGYEVNIIL